MFPYPTRKNGKKKNQRSGVYPNHHMDSSGVASACNLNTRSQTLTWMGSNVRVCKCVYIYVLFCVQTGCMCPCVRRPWHLLMKKSRQRIFPMVTSCPSTPGILHTSLSYWLVVTTQCPECDQKYASLCVCMSANETDSNSV